MTKTFRMRTVALVAGALLLPALAGCSRSPSEEAPAADTMQNDAGVSDVAPADTTPAMTNMAEPMPAANTAAEDAPPPPPARTVDQQMMDDASATGMTARVQRDASPADDAPAQDQSAANAE